MFACVQANGNRKLEISRVLTKAKLREPAYSQALVQNKIDIFSRSDPSVRQEDSPYVWAYACMYVCIYVCVLGSLLCQNAIWYF